MQHPPGFPLRRLLNLQPADAALFALVMAIVGMLMVPLPTWALDLLLASNLALAMLMLITALRVPRGLAFSSLPTVLLLTTLYRLALNVSSTRLILLQADAGRVIRAFGEFVVQGNYAVGAVVFVIITIIQYLVVAKGSERVAEVGARFTLDALPGKQLAIDADLRAGVLSPDAARARRAELERESQFYGALDGAMKFVKGDAIAGIAIAAICFVGGTAVGSLLQGRPWLESTRVYGLLTIGDALVSQIPSLVISTAAGLVVTRVAETERDSSLGDDIAAQLFAAPAVLLGASAFLAALGLVPGLPAGPFLFVSALLGAAAYAVDRLRASAQPLPAIQPRILLELADAPTDAEREELERALGRVTRATCQRLGLPEASTGIAHQPALPAGSYCLLLRDAPVVMSNTAQHSRLAQHIEREFGQLLVRHARELLDMHDVQQRLDALSARSPQYVRGVVARAVTLPALTAILRQLLDEGVSLRAFDRILEAICASADRPAHQQLEAVRRALREQIVHALALQELEVHRLDPLIEDSVRDAIVTRGSERALALPPDLAREIVRAARSTLAATPSASVLTQSDIRRCVYELLAQELPQVRVLSYDELPPTTQIQEREPIRV